MQIKVGIIGTEAFNSQVQRVIKSFPTIRPISRTAANEREAVAAAEELGAEVEALVLSGALSNRAVKLGAETSVPSFYVPLNGAGLYKALFSAFRAGKLEGGISVDSLTKAMVMRTLTDLGLEQAKVFVYDGPAYSSPERMATFHRQLFFPQVQAEDRNVPDGIPGGRGSAGEAAGMTPAGKAERRPIRCGPLERCRPERRRGVRYVAAAGMTPPERRRRRPIRCRALLSFGSF